MTKHYDLVVIGTGTAAMVGAMRQPNLAGCQGYSRAAGGAAAGQRGVPGIAGLAEHLVEGGAACREFRRVRLGEDEAAIGLQPLNHRV